MTTLCLKTENSKDEKSIIFDVNDSQAYETSYKFNLKNKLDIIILQIMGYMRIKKKHIMIIIHNLLFIGL